MVGWDGGVGGSTGNRTWWCLVQQKERIWEEAFSLSTRCLCDVCVSLLLPGLTRSDLWIAHKYLQDVHDASHVEGWGQVGVAMLCSHVWDWPPSELYLPKVFGIFRSILLVCLICLADTTQFVTTWQSPMIADGRVGAHTGHKWWARLFFKIEIRFPVADSKPVLSRLILSDSVVDCTDTTWLSVLNH